MADKQSETKKIYPEAQSNPNFPKIEEEILAFWNDSNIFQKSIDQREGHEFVFYDGPPFANGLPHYGHLVTSYVKDIVPRYKTMKGHKVERRFGWDCHGLPAELQVEKELGISGRLQILDYGMAKFNDQCRKSVLKFTREWEYYVTRMARWVDFENDYKTHDKDFMESVLWAFKTLHDKGLIYEGYRVVPYSWAVESPLSNFETRMDNSYRSRQDPAITVAFKLDKGIGHDDNNPNQSFGTVDTPTYMLAWTTTPWTMPSNLALAVGNDISYAVIAKDGAHYILAEAALPRYEREFGEEPEIVVTLKGSDLTGRSYQPPFDYFRDTENAFHVLPADFITEDDGTGIGHQAPGFGEDDMILCQNFKIPVRVPIDSKGRFTSEVPDFEGMLWRDANKPIIQAIKERGLLLRHETIDHNYPHCWRTDEPLIYKAINSWYLDVTKIKDKMVELNQKINWIPDHVKDGQFGRWLENARDWNIARNRFWGTPIPVWQSDNPDYPRTDVYGSIEELEKDFGVTIDDLHRPYIDELTRPNPDDPSGNSTMRRVEDVLDCWFESGSMPFAQVHYPFENKDWFEKHFPGDFIVEYIAQTRGWFYTLTVLATALFEKNPFENCICHGVVLDEDRNKLSKSKSNYPDPREVFDTYGSDILRWYMVSSPLMTGGDLSISADGKEIGQTRNQIINPIWNAYSFFTLYANADGIKGELIKDANNTLDRYILAKTRTMLVDVETAMDQYDLPAACHHIWSYLDALTNWYIRRSRDRFWRSGKDADKREAYNTLYTVLHTLCRAAAPFLPFITEKIYKSLTGEESVHLAHFPDKADLSDNPELVQAMDRVRETCSAALSVRDNEGLRVRLPLNELIVAAVDAEILEPYIDLIKDEVNVKTVTLSSDLEEYGSLELKVNPAIGKRLKGKMKEVMAAAKSGDWTDNENGTVSIAGETLGPDDFSMRLHTEEGLSSQQLSGQGAVILDTKLTPELEREGLARDLVRLIQTTRKDADLDISDRIHLELEVEDDLLEAAKDHAEFIKSETLATSLSLSLSDSAEYTGEHELSGQSVRIAVGRVQKAA